MFNFRNFNTIFLFIDDFHYIWRWFIWVLYIDQKTSEKEEKVHAIQERIYHKSHELGIAAGYIPDDDFFELFYSLYYKFDYKQLARFGKKYHKIMQELPCLLNTEKDCQKLVFNICFITSLIYDLNGALIALNLSWF